MMSGEARERDEREQDSRAASATRKPETPQRRGGPRTRRRCNQLDGKRWLQNSISVWGDIRKTAEESRLKHPAMFPVMLAERLMDCFLPPEGHVVLDPFAGSGSTLLAAEQLGHTGIGIELSAEYVELIRMRLAAQSAHHRARVHHGSAQDLLNFVEPESVDLCVSSPPYWNILNQKRTADAKTVRHYGNLDGDLGTIENYAAFLESVTGVFADVFHTLRPGGYCCLIVMDLRKKNRFFPLHSDLASRLSECGYVFDDLIIWNRQSEYNNLRPLGYPSVFRINKVHEFVVLLQRPRTRAACRSV